MSCKSLMLFVSWAIIPLLFFGCGDKTPKNKVKKAPERQKVSVPALPEKDKKVAELTVKQQDDKQFSYGASGKRDPFQALTSVKKPIVQGPAETTPLQKFGLNQLRVIGVIWGKGDSTAMVNAPDGKSYVLKKGIKAGKNNGTVVDINKESIVVEEKFYDFSGEVRVSMQNIPLPKKEGVK